MAVTPLELARTAAIAADDKKAADIVVIDLSQASDICDYFVICTARSKPHSDAIVEEVREKVKANCNERPLSVEGKVGSSWALIDFGVVVVHVFRPESRDYYRLERLWGDAPRVDFGLEGAVEEEGDDKQAVALQEG
ncbi:MAG: ribosome silencing factor [Atopobiaceae bacterium]|jgi:ribosome-associated protein|nr:ribosome silencing factor [Olegusella sp.]NLH91302.1 ribosome silencing factor [Atopobium sp.]